MKAFIYFIFLFYFVVCGVEGGGVKPAIIYVETLGLSTNGNVLETCIKKSYI